MICDCSTTTQDDTTQTTHPSSSCVITLSFGIGKLGCDLLFKQLCLLFWLLWDLVYLCNAIGCFGNYFVGEVIFLSFVGKWNLLVDIIQADFLTWTVCLCCQSLLNGWWIIEFLWYERDDVNVVWELSCSVEMSRATKWQTKISPSFWLGFQMQC